VAVCTAETCAFIVTVPTMVGGVASSASRMTRSAMRAMSRPYRHLRSGSLRAVGRSSFFPLMYR